MLKQLTFLLVFSLAIYQTHQLLVQANQNKLDNSAQKYLPCLKIPHVIFALNNNSVSTAVPDGKNLYIALSAKNPLIYRYPIKSRNHDQANILGNNLSDQPYQILKQSVDTSAVAFTNDGTHLAVGCGNQNTNIYVFNGSQYILKQSLKSSYFKHGSRVVFSEDGHYLFTIQSLKQINVYILGANLYQLSQTISVNLQAVTLFSLTKDAKYFSVIQKNSSYLLITVYTFQKQTNKYVKLPHVQPMTQLISDISMNNNFIAVATVSLFPSNCSTIIYRMAIDGQSFKPDQQIFRGVDGCITSLYLSSKNQMILTNTYTSSYVYQYSDEPHVYHFLKKYDIYHQVQGAPIHTEIRLMDTNDWHLIIYTGVQINLFCPGIENFYLSAS